MRVHRLNLYVKRQSLVHDMDPRAKAIALVGFLIAVLAITPLSPQPVLILSSLLICGALLSRVPAKTLCVRVLSLALIIGVPFGLSRFGSHEMRAAGNVLAVKSLLTAAAFLVFTATTPATALFEMTGRFPPFAAFSRLGEFILRGTDLLAEEVTRANRAWILRAPSAGICMRVKGLTWVSLNLIVRAAVRSERVGAAMVLRGYDGRFPPSSPRRLPAAHIAAGLFFALVSLLAAGGGRWL